MVEPSDGSPRCKVNGKHLAAQGEGAFRRVNTILDLIRIRLFEAIVRSRILWLGIFSGAWLFELLGLKVFAARLFASGQRSAPQALRGSFGRAAMTRVDTIVASMVEGPAEELLAENRIRVLKPFIGRGEKGVIHVMFSAVISALPQKIDLETLNTYYRLVLEPSWAGVCDPGILQYARTRSKNIIMVPDSGDFAFVDELSSQLVPVSLGSADWVDPRVAEPYLGTTKKFDIVMNASWAPWKRHHVLFSAMSRMKRKPKVALVGASWSGGDLARIAGLAGYYEVTDHITVFERIPFQMVMQVVCSSRCCVLLSLKEGANRALPESMFCNVPVLLLAEYIGGAEKNIVPQTGLIVPERDLAQGFASIISGERTFSPRQWALDNISCVVSTAKLNAKLRQIAEEEGECWTQDIVVRSNSPESKYFDSSAEVELAAANAAVAKFVRGDGLLPIQNPI